jgi:predicted nucleic acid-binding protein
MRVLVDTSISSLSLRKHGPTDHPTVEKLTTLLQADEDVVLTGCQVAIAAIRHDCLLLSADKDFESIAPLSDLRLA